MLSAEILEKLKIFFIKQYINFGFVENKFVDTERIVDKILKNAETNGLFCKICFPNLGNVKIFSKTWIERILQIFLMSKQGKEVFETVSIKQTANKVKCIRYIAKETNQDQNWLLEIIIKTIIKKKNYPLSKIKNEVEKILNNDQQLKNYLKPILKKLTKQQIDPEVEICLMTGNFVKFLRRIKFLYNWRDLDSGEIVFSLTSPKELCIDNNRDFFKLSGYLRHIDNDCKSNNDIDEINNRCSSNRSEKKCSRSISFTPKT